MRGEGRQTSGLGVLSPHSEAIVVPQSPVALDLLEPLEIITELRVDSVGEDLRVLAIDDVALSVEEPGRDLVLGGVLDDGDETLEFFGGELSSAALGEVY